MKSAKGFTLPELLIGVAVLAILTAAAMPGFDAVIRRRTVDGEASQLFTTVYLGRSEAIKRNSTVTLCKSADQATCSGSWSDGWILFSDKNANRIVDGEDVILSIVDGLAGGYGLKWSAFGSSNYLNFETNGLTNQNGTFTFCPPDNDTRFGKKVIVSKTARVRFSTDGITCP